MSSKVDRAITGLLIAVTLAMLGVVGQRFLAQENKEIDEHAAGYEIGERFAELPDESTSLDYSTLLVWVRSGCKFCTASMPFYKTLAARTGVTRVVVAGHESVEVLKAYVSTHGFVPDGFLSVPRRSDSRIAATPTLVLLSPDLTVQGFWVGQLSPGLEGEVLQKIR